MRLAGPAQHTTGGTQAIGFRIVLDLKSALYGAGGFGSIRATESVSSLFLELIQQNRK